MHEGEWSTRLGIPGHAGRGRGADGHARHRAVPPHRRAASTSSTCPPPGRSTLVRAAKAAGLPVTAEATPHHFTLTDAEVPALRPGVQGQPARCGTAADVAAVKAGLADGTIDAIATDHAPHAPGDQGAALRRGARRGCSAWRRRWPWPSPSW